MRYSGGYGYFLDDLAMALSAALRRKQRQQEAVESWAQVRKDREGE